MIYLYPEMNSLFDTSFLTDISDMYFGGRWWKSTAANCSVSWHSQNFPLQEANFHFSLTSLVQHKEMQHAP